MSRFYVSKYLDTFQNLNLEADKNGEIGATPQSLHLYIRTLFFFSTSVAFIFQVHVQRVQIGGEKMGEGIPGDKIPVIQLPVNQGTIFFHHIFLVVQLGLENFGPGVHVAGDSLEFCVRTIIVPCPQADGISVGVLFDYIYTFGKDDILPG